MEQNRMTPRPVSASRAEHTQILLAEHLNGSGRLFGGRLMEWIDRHHGRRCSAPPFRLQRHHRIH